jgi:DNA-binding transcriptional MerR regulator
MSSETYLSISEAARATGKSIPTIRAYLTKGKLPNATSSTKGESRAWKIPLTDLVVAGLLDQVTTPSEPEPTATPSTPTLGERVAALEAENRQLRERLDEALKDKQLFSTMFASQLETRQVQENRRRRWFSRPRRESFDNLPGFTSDN